MLRKLLLVPLATTALALTACGGADITGTTTPTASTSPTANDTAGATPSASTAPVVDTGTSTPGQPAPGSATSSTPAPTSLDLDGRTVPLVSECSGVDGAVLVTTQGEVTIMLVREDGLALRYSGEGAMAETSDVTTVENADGTATYTGTISGPDTGTVAVALTLAPSAAGLPAC